MPSALTPIGYDMPNVQPPQVATPLVDAQADTTPLQLINQQSAGFAAALQQQSLSFQQQAQSSNALSQATAASANAIAQVTQQAAAARAERSAKNAQSIAQLSVSISNAGDKYLERVDRQQQQQLRTEQNAAQAEKARQAALAEQAKLAATQKLEQQKLTWTRENLFEKQGSQAYVGELVGNLKDPALAPDDIAELTRQYITPAHDYEGYVRKNQQEKAAKVKETQQQISSLELQGKLNASFGVIGSSATRSPDELLAAKATVDVITREFLSSSVIPQEDKYVILRDSYQELLKRMDKSNAEYNTIAVTTDNLRNVVNYESQLYEQVRANKITASEARAAVLLRAAQLGVPYSPSDINLNSKVVEELLANGDRIQSLQDKREQNAIENLEPNNAVIVGLSTEAYLNPASYAGLKQAARSGVNANAVAALKTVDDFKQFVASDLPEYNTKRASLNLQLQQINDDFNKWWVNQLKPDAQQQQALNFQKQLDVLRGAQLTPQTVQQGGLRPEMAELVTRSRNDIINAIYTQAATLDANHQNKLAEFARVGLSPDVTFVQANRKKAQRAIDGYNQRIEEAKLNKVRMPEQESSKPNFSQGKIMPLPRKQYVGRQMIFPFPVDVATAIPDAFEGQKYGAPRKGRTHDGLDWAVPNGTPVLTVMGGTVQRVQRWDGKKADYGNNLEVLGDDGLTYHFAHLDGFNVTDGQRVAPGQQLGVSGSTGAGSGPHLHMGVYNVVNGVYNAIDPAVHLETLWTSKAPPPKQPRTSGNSLKPPVGAIPLGNNQYLSGGKVLNLSANTQVPATYNKAQPIRNSYSSRNAADYKPGLPEEPHGYAQLAANPQLAKRINDVAAKYNMPGQWLADVIAYESANTFSPGKPNGTGFYGLIQFGPEVMQDLGVNVRQLTSMTAVQQMDLVDKYLGLRLRQSGVKAYKGPEWLVAGINQGNVGIQQVDKLGAQAVLDSRNSDGYTTLLKYMQTLGKYSGRQYDYLGNRSRRASLPIHDGTPRSDCASCIAMTHFGGQIVAHIAQPQNAWTT